MIRHCLYAAFCTLLLSLSGQLISPAQQAPKTAQSASIPHLNVQVWVDYTASHKPFVRVVFSTDNRKQENVNCLNAYRDIHYVLRDSSGRVMPQDPEAWKKELDTVTSQGQGYDCGVLPWTVKYSRAFLETLFPSAPHGIYTLQMALAPRGRNDRATFTPVTVEL